MEEQKNKASKRNSDEFSINSFNLSPGEKSFQNSINTLGKQYLENKSINKYTQINSDIHQKKKHNKFNKIEPHKLNNDFDEEKWRTEKSNHLLSKLEMTDKMTSKYAFNKLNDGNLATTHKINPSLNNIINQCFTGLKSFSNKSNNSNLILNAYRQSLKNPKFKKNPIEFGKFGLYY